jgi:class 3 adenylate cyclase
MTALFADIKVSMDLMENLDPEKARAIVDPAIRLTIDAANRYDGYVVHSTGDGIFALSPVELRIIRNGKAFGLKPSFDLRVCKPLGVGATVNQNGK